MKRKTLVYAGCMHRIGPVVTPRGPDYRVANPSKEASRGHQIDPVAAVRKAPDYALVLFTSGVFHSPD